MKISWVFDVISPFAYLNLQQLDRLPANVAVEYVPVLFAGLLNHHGQIGPAEIASKRRFTYRFALWRARKMGIPMRFPPAHPFNPLKPLRLIIAAGNSREAIGTVFDAIFRHGRDVADTEVLEDLARQLHVRDWQQAIAQPDVKDKLARQHGLGNRSRHLWRAHIRHRQRAVLGTRRIRNGARLSARAR